MTKHRDPENLTPDPQIKSPERSRRYCDSGLRTPEGLGGEALKEIRRRVQSSFVRGRGVRAARLDGVRRALSPAASRDLPSRRLRVESRVCGRTVICRVGLQHAALIESQIHAYVHVPAVIPFFYNTHRRVGVLIFLHFLHPNITLLLLIVRKDQVGGIHYRRVVLSGALSISIDLVNFQCVSRLVVVLLGCWEVVSELRHQLQEGTKEMLRRQHIADNRRDDRDSRLI
ncbi:hypothetical protein EYF80_045375 [Liparis tanakae]|uniref:Uncharacterized protein n=1 Tax=Liparis tanakae TaxID=230148 RepID=A0A4Z2FTS9_9TELE|nr:hypothetical protein EYF80_045375 [Liparis tanakae]